MLLMFYSMIFTHWYYSACNTTVLSASRSDDTVSRISPAFPFDLIMTRHLPSQAFLDGDVKLSVLVGSAL